MKKLVLITALIASLSHSAFAKTQGNQVGVDLLYATAKHDYNGRNTYGKFDDKSVGYGLNYKYALNFDNVFVAPGVFAEKLGTEAKDRDRDSVLANYRYGAKVDIGYDITDQFAVYATGGAASVNYKVDWKSVGSKTTGNKIGYVYGAGVAFSATKNLVFNLEYNIQKVDFKTPVLGGGITTAETTLSVAKVGVSYRF